MMHMCGWWGIWHYFLPWYMYVYVTGEVYANFIPWCMYMCVVGRVYAMIWVWWSENNFVGSVLLSKIFRWVPGIKLSSQGLFLLLIWVIESYTLIITYTHHTYTSTHNTNTHDHIHRHITHMHINIHITDTQTYCTHIYVLKYSNFSMKTLNSANWRV